MNLQALIKKSLNVIKQNAPEILTGIGVGGVVATSYLTGRAAFKSAQVIHNFEEENGRHEDPKARLKERAKLSWKFYLLPAVSGGVTIVCIVMSHKTSARRTATAIAAYAVSEKTFAEFREKLAEELGPNKEQKIRDAMAQDAVDKDPSRGKQVIITGNGGVLFREAYTGRYLETDMESIMRAVNQYNNMVNNCTSVALSEFYDLIGLDPTDQSGDVGWNTDKLMELQFSAVVDHDAGKPVLVFSYEPPPKPLWS